MADKTPGWVKEVEFLPDTGAGGSLFILMRLEQDSPVLVALLAVTLRNSGLLSMSTRSHRLSARDSALLRFSAQPALR